MVATSQFLPYFRMSATILRGTLRFHKDGPALLM